MIQQLIAHAQEIVNQLGLHVDINSLINAGVGALGGSVFSGLGVHHYHRRRYRRMRLKL